MWFSGSVTVQDVATQLATYAGEGAGGVHFPSGALGQNCLLLSVVVFILSVVVFFNFF